MARVSYDGQCHPFLWLRAEGWHAPAGRRTCEPRPLVQDGQIRPAAPAVAIKTWARPTDRFAGQPERRQPIRRSGRDPGLRPYARTTTKPGKQGRKHYPHSPCRKHYPHSPCRLFAARRRVGASGAPSTDQPVRAASALPCDRPIWPRPRRSLLLTLARGSRLRLLAGAVRCSCAATDPATMPSRQGIRVRHRRRSWKARPAQAARSPAEVPYRARSASNFRLFAAAARLSSPRPAGRSGKTS
jgi:hypothetical protein